MILSPALLSRVLRPVIPTNPLEASGARHPRLRRPVSWNGRAQRLHECRSLAAAKLTWRGRIGDEGRKGLCWDDATSIATAIALAQALGEDDDVVGLVMCRGDVRNQAIDAQAASVGGRIHGGGPGPPRTKLLQRSVASEAASPER